LGTIGILNFCCEAEGEAEASKKSRDFIFGGRLDEGKKSLDLRTKSRPEFLAGPKLTFHRSLLFSLLTRSIEDENSHSVF
jgi:hypothetical protein